MSFVTTGRCMEYLAKKGDIAKMRQEILNGGSIHEEDDYSYNAALGACINGKFEALRFIAANGGNMFSW